MGGEGRGGRGEEERGGEGRLKTGPPGHPNPATPLNTGLHPLLPAWTQNRHGLRHRRHDRELPTKTAQLDESNFFNRNVV